MKMNAMHQFAMSKFATSQSRDDAMLEEIDMLQGKVKDLSAVLNHHKTLKAENAALKAELVEYQAKRDVAVSTLELVKSERQAAQKALNEQCKEAVKLKAELAAAQAVIEKMREAVNSFINSPITVEPCRKVPALIEHQPDLSALREHDADVCQEFANFLGIEKREDVVKWIVAVRKGE